MKNILYIFVILLLFKNCYAQYSLQTIKADTVFYTGQKEILLLSNNINSSSIEIFSRNIIHPIRSYKYFPLRHRIKLSPEFSAQPGDTLIIYYRQYPNIYESAYKLRELHTILDDDSTESSMSMSVENKDMFSRSEIFGNKIVSSGLLSRGFTVGTTKDFSLNSGLRLEMSGKLSDEIEIYAMLTDENTPIQPEGNTETLDELDKVFIQLKHKNVTGIFGDIDYKNSVGEFGKIQRKLKGFQADFTYENSNASLVFASERGKYTRNTFTGIDGVQGPYRLLGENNERNIVIVAGSERVFIDGIELKRGENNDYTVNYATAELFFTSSRMITSSSRISIEFEYSDRQYQRNYFGVNTDVSFYKDDLKIFVNYFQETDDQDNPLDISLDDNEREILRNAGADKYAAVINGASLAEPDSLGKIVGSYTKVDTLIAGEQYSYYKYLPGEESSNYNVVFSFVGESKGDYIRNGLGNYQFVGIKNGSYLPIRFLPLPVSKQMANILLETNPYKNLEIKLELAGSIFDANRFSEIDDGKNNGFARRIEVNYLPSQIKIADNNLGKVGFSFFDRFRDNNFNPLDRIDDVEFSRYYNLPDNIVGNEHLTETTFSYAPWENIGLTTSYGRYRKGEDFSSDRYQSEVKFTGDDLYNLDYHLDYVTTQLMNINSDWLRQNGSTFYRLGNIKLELNYEAEDKKEYTSSSDSLSANSLSLFELNPKINLISVAGINIVVNYSFRQESFPVEGNMEHASNAYTKGLGLNYRTNKIYSDFNLAMRKKEYSDLFKGKGFTNNETVLIKSQDNVTIGDNFIRGSLFYEAATEKNSRMEKVFLRVPQGTGNYKYLGDLNNNGITEENEFEPSLYDGDYIITTYPTDELFPVVDLKFNTRWIIDFKKHFTKNNFVSKMLKPISTETSWRLAENSRETDISKIYLLNLLYFLKDSTTIRGTNSFMQDFFLFKNKRDFSLRLRYLQQRGLNEYSSGIEKSYLRERSLKLRLGLIKEILNQTEYVNKNDIVDAPVFSNRNRQVVNNEISTDFSFRPYTELELGLKIISGESDDYYPTLATKISYNSQEIRVTYSMFNKGRLRFELERSEYLVNTDENYIPFEITKGNVIGKNYIGRVNFEYKIGTNLQTTLNYVGRFHGSGRLINTLRAEARAFF